MVRKILLFHFKTFLVLAQRRMFLQNVCVQSSTISERISLIVLYLDDGVAFADYRYQCENVLNFIQST